MTLLAIVAVLVGALLGLRFKVLVLLPVMALILAIAIFALTKVILVVVGLQIGWVLGAIAGHLMPRQAVTPKNPPLLPQSKE